MEKNKTRWLRLLLGCVTLLMAGIIYAWTNLRAPLRVAFTEWTEAQMQLCFTLTLCFFCLGGMFSGLLSKRVSMRLRMIAAAIFVIIGFLLIKTLDGEIWKLYLGYGILAGTGIGIVYNVVIAATNAWFPDRKGLSSGALMMSFGFSALMFGKIGTVLFREEVLGWRNTFLIFGIVIAIIIGISAFLVKNPPKKEIPKEENAEEKTDAPTETNDVPTEKMIRRFSFWKLFVFFTLLAAVGSTAIGFGKNFFLSVGLGDETATTVAGLLSIFNGLGRLFSGAFYDRAGIRKTQYVTSAVAILAPLMCLFATMWTVPALGIIGLCLCAFSYGFSPTVSAAFAGSFYGTTHFSLNFSVLNLVLIPASFVSTLAGGLYQSSGAYVSTFVVLTAMSVVGFVINLSIKRA